ncbi:unnamed protein product [Brassica napus]|uniref:(rape) hypothetical protein n=2 Tax=Brassica napus TaxID=3708 RepID=A0A816J423_BRANA|nr:unnamed protein product [Brassica napus]
MAISLFHPMLLLILSLFFLPTLLAIPFDDCGFKSYPIKVTGVELFKEQHKASFNITVSTNKVITGGIVHLQVQYGYKTIMDHTYNLSELITCPFSPGAVVLSFRKQFPYAKEVS